jgi:hypothetical protein
MYELSNNKEVIFSLLKDSCSGLVSTTRIKYRMPYRISTTRILKICDIISTWLKTN